MSQNLVLALITAVLRTSKLHEHFCNSTLTRCTSMENVLVTCKTLLRLSPRPLSLPFPAPPPHSLGGDRVPVWPLLGSSRSLLHQRNEDQGLHTAARVLSLPLPPTHGKVLWSQRTIHGQVTNIRGWGTLTTVEPLTLWEGDNLSMKDTPREDNLPTKSCPLFRGSTVERALHENETGRCPDPWKPDMKDVAHFHNF